jgi:hypothetical protein
MVKVKAHREEPLKNELTPKLTMHDSYHQNVGNGHLALLD